MLLNNIHMEKGEKVLGYNWVINESYWFLVNLKLPKRFELMLLHLHIFHATDWSIPSHLLICFCPCILFSVSLWNCIVPTHMSTCLFYVLRPHLTFLCVIPLGGFYWCSAQKKISLKWYEINSGQLHAFFQISTNHYKTTVSQSILFLTNLFFSSHTH